MSDTKDGAPLKAPKGQLRFRDRDPRTIGIWGALGAVVLMGGSLNYDRIPYVNGLRNATAYVADAAGLNTGDSVQVAGMKVGLLVVPPVRVTAGPVPPARAQVKLSVPVGVGSVEADASRATGVVLVVTDRSAPAFATGGPLTGVAVVTVMVTVSLLVRVPSLTVTSKV